MFRFCNGILLCVSISALCVCVVFGDSFGSLALGKRDEMPPHRFAANPQVNEQKERRGSKSRNANHCKHRTLLPRLYFIKTSNMPRWLPLPLRDSLSAPTSPDGTLVNATSDSTPTTTPLSTFRPFRLEPRPSAQEDNLPPHFMGDMLTGCYLRSMIKALRNADPKTASFEYQTRFAAFFAHGCPWTHVMVEDILRPALFLNHVLERMLDASLRAGSLEESLTCCRVGLPSLLLAVRYYARKKDTMARRFSYLPKSLQKEAMALLPAINELDDYDFVLGNLLTELSDAVDSVLVTKIAPEAQLQSFGHCLAMLEEAANELWKEQPSSPSAIVALFRRITGKPRTKVTPDTKELPASMFSSSDYAPPRRSHDGRPLAGWRRTRSFRDAAFRAYDEKAPLVIEQVEKKKSKVPAMFRVFLGKQNK